METNKRKALGKGLEQLFSNESLYVNPLEKVEEIEKNSKEEDIVMVNTSELRSNPYQPRQKFDQEKLVELANSIKEFGVLEPIIIKKSIKGYEIVAGERRKKACELVGVEQVPAIIRDFSDEDMMQIALLENIQRENLTAIEEAEAISNLLNVLKVSQEELAVKIGKSRSYITNLLGLLNLPENVKNDILHGLISMGHAKVLSKLEDNDLIVKLSQKIKDEHLSVRALEELTSGEDYKRKNPIVKIKEKENNKYEYVEDSMTDLIGNRVRIKNKKIIIPFNSDKDLERILDILSVEVKVD